MYICKVVYCLFLVEGMCFTLVGMYDTPVHTAVAEGDSLDDMYNKVKNVIHEQSGNYIWVPSADSL